MSKPDEITREPKSLHEQKPWLIKPGEVRNPKGRPKGSRNKLNEDFIVALCAHFAEHGLDAIARVHAERPDVYLKVVASLQPKEFEVRDRTLEEMSDNEVFEALQSIRALKEEALRQRRLAKSRHMGSKKVPAVLDLSPTGKSEEPRSLQ